MNRREFIRGAVIASAVAATFRRRSGAGPAIGQNHAISAVLYDDRYEDCRIFAESLAERGALTFPTNGDAGRLWYGSLREHLARHPGMVAGMTTDSDWSLSRGCGREAGFVVAYEGSHDARMRNSMSHSLRGRGIERDIYAALLAGELRWTAAIADALTRPRNERTIDAGRHASTVAILPSADPPLYLTSWLLQHS